MIARLDGTLEGRKGLVVGIANAHSIAYGCAGAFRALGAELAVTYLNDKARPYVEPLAQELQAPIFLPCDVQDDAQVDGLFAAIRQRWGRLDFALHAVAFAPKPDLQGRLTDSSREGFLMAMDISCHSFIRLARRAEPLMTDGGALLTLSFAGAERVVRNYDLMGPVKAALECAVRYLAYELGPKGIRVHALSPGPIHTRAGLRTEGLRRDRPGGAAQGTPRPPGRDRRRGRDGRLPGKPGGERDHRDDHLRGWRIPHHGLTAHR